MFLAFDTSTLTLSLALLERGAPNRVVEHLLIGPPHKQSELLPAVIGELLERHGVKLASLEGIVVGLGPGSFTGLRIGLATAKALGYAARIPIAGASSLAAVALQGPEHTPLIPLAVARAQELYLGRYRREGLTLTSQAVEDAMTPEGVAELAKANPDALLLGPALPEYRAQLEALGVPKQRLLETGGIPTALALGELTTLPDHYDPQALFALEPHYVRASGAERNPKFPPTPGWAPTARLKQD